MGVGGGGGWGGGGGGGGGGVIDGMQPAQSGVAGEGEQSGHAAVTREEQMTWLRERERERDIPGREKVESWVRTEGGLEISLY